MSKSKYTGNLEQLSYRLFIGPWFGIRFSGKGSSISPIWKVSHPRKYEVLNTEWTLCININPQLEQTPALQVDSYLLTDMGQVRSYHEAAWLVIATWLLEEFTNMWAFRFNAVFDNFDLYLALDSTKWILKWTAL